jgi:hypothetical protein
MSLPTSKYKDAWQKIRDSGGATFRYPRNLHKRLEKAVRNYKSLDQKANGKDYGFLVVSCEGDEIKFSFRARQHDSL